MVSSFQKVAANIMHDVPGDEEGFAVFFVKRDPLGLRKQRLYASGPCAIRGQRTIRLLDRYVARGKDVVA